MFRNEFKNVLIVASLALSSGSVVFAATPTAPPVDQRRADYLAHQAELNIIQANRQGVIQDIVDFWTAKLSVNDVSHWEEGMTDALSRASNEILLKIKKAESYSEVLAILRGHQQLLSGSAANDLTGPASVGDSPSDLVYTPVSPCRIFDTRLVGGAYGDATRNYYVYGDSATMIAQGGNPAGCPAPQGEPSSVSANFTVVPVMGGNGFITPYPYGTPKPLASFVNYNATIIANSGIISTTYDPASYDISVYHSGITTHSLADVMGYFYPATPAANFAWGSPAGALIGDGQDKLHSFGYSVQITTTTNNQKVFWTAHQPVGTASSAGNLNIWPCWKASSAPDVPASWKTEGGGSFNITMTGTQRNIVSSSAVVAPGVGAHDFSLCYSTDDANWNFNDFGYVAAQMN